MKDNLAQKAVSAALSGKWEEALKLNEEILKRDANDIDTLNRLARAHAELGDLTSARKVAKKTLELDPFNSIAQKSLAKWKGLKKGETISSNLSGADAFLEEPGKTKIVPLIHLGDNKVIAKLNSGDEVKISPFKHRVSVNTIDGKYIGRLPDDLSARIRKLVGLGNEYRVLIKSIKPDEIKVFVREVKRSPKLTDIPSFSSEKIDYISFVSPELVHKKEPPLGVIEEE